MKKPPFVRGAARLSPLLFALLLLLLAAPASATGALHPAPSVIHDYKVIVTPSSADVILRFIVSPQLVPQVYRNIDTDFDALTSDAEQKAWLDKYTSNLAVTVDGEPHPFTVTSAPTVSREALLLSSSRPISVTMHVEYPALAPSSKETSVEHRFGITDGTDYVGYDEYYVNFVDGSGVIVTGHDTQNMSDPAIFEGTFEVDPSAAPTNSGTTPTPASEPSGSDLLLKLQDFLAAPNKNISLGIFIFLLAVGVGALHALTPGHGKAVVAAYLVGSRGRVRDAILLGLTVTITHTSTVVLLGLVLLLVNNFAMPRYLQPLLELISGLLIVGLGGWLLWQRWRSMHAAQPAIVGAVTNPGQTLAYAAAPAATHFHGTLEHSHGADGHTHSHAPAQVTSLRDLIALGISGGLVPCPDALAILLLAAGLSQIIFGLALVVSFSIGLAATLIGIGILMVKAKGLLEKLLPGAGNPTWVRWLPVVSAIAVIVLGIVVVAGAALGQKWA